MMPSSLRFLPVLPLLLLPATHAVPAPLQRLASWEKSPESCQRAELLGYLRHEDVRVRSAALDLLESVTGRDFGFDPWLPPAEQPAEVSQQLEAWAAAEQSLGKAGEKPGEEQLRHAVALLRDADPDTLRRTCLRFAGHSASLIAALQRELAQGADALNETERDHLKLALYRIQLQESMGDEAGRAAGLLASHARNDQLDGLEMLRKAGSAALPVAACFVEAEDGLLRETAVDIFLQLGKTHAFLHLLPALEKDGDRNILQMAARRALDCDARVGVIRFLNRCAVSEDEDVSVAGLDALRELRLDDDDNDKPTRATAPAGAERNPALRASREDALSAEQFVALTRSPHWRVRAAAIGMMESKSAFLPASTNKDVAAAIIAALEDADETVRQTALRVMYRRGLSNDTSLETFAHRNPASAPFAVYLFARNRHRMSDGMCELVRRFTPAQVDELFTFEDEFDDVFSEDNPGATAKRVLELLGENPDPAVMERLVFRTGAQMFLASPEKAAAVMAWLESPDVLREEKKNVVEEMARALMRDSFENDTLKERAERGFAEVDARFRAWLETTAQEEGSLGISALTALAKQDSARAVALIDARLAAVGAGQQPNSELVEELTTESEIMSKLSPDSIIKLMQHEDCRWTAFSALVKSERGLELLRATPLPDHTWYDIVLRELEEDLRDARLYPRRSSSLADMPVTAEEKAAAASYEVYGMEPWVVPLLDHYLRHAEPAARRAEVAFILLCRRPVLELDDVARGLGTLAKAEEVLMAADADFARCIIEAPCKPEEVVPWTARHAGSAHLHTRLAVAGCLLPCSVPRFILPLPDKASGSRSFLLAPCPMGCKPELKRVSCPRELLDLVRGMQADENPHVALVACASMLYRTGDCDRERFRELLRSLQQSWESEGREMNYEYYALIRDQLNGAWERWSEYRRGVTEPFKLKGSPKRVPDDMLPLLAELHRMADNSWNLQDELKQKVRALAGEGESDTLLPGSPLTFHAVTKDETPPPADTPPATDTPGALADADEAETPADEAPPVAVDAPFRVEYFHRHGCDTCERVARELEELRRNFPGMQLVDYAIESDEGYARNEVLCSRFGVPSAHRHKAPILFAESGFLMGEEIAGASLRSLLESSRQKGEARKLAASPQPKSDEETAAPASDAPAVTPPPAQPDLLAETSAGEAAAAESTAWWEALRRYGVLALGAVVALLALLLVLFNRTNKNDKVDS